MLGGGGDLGAGEESGGDVFTPPQQPTGRVCGVCRVSFCLYAKRCVLKCGYGSSMPLDNRLMIQQREREREGGRREGRGEEKCQSGNVTSQVTVPLPTPMF